MCYGVLKRIEVNSITNIMNCKIVLCLCLGLITTMTIDMLKNIMEHFQKYKKCYKNQFKHSNDFLNKHYGTN